MVLFSWSSWIINLIDLIVGVLENSVAHHFLVAGAAEDPT